MKNLLVLPGGSRRNVVWGESCEAFFKKYFDSTKFLRYDHWENGEENVDFETEIIKIKRHVESAKSKEWYIFAKSIGSIIAIKAFEADVIRPVRSIFFGMPLNLMADNDWSALATYSVSTIAFHNQEDPIANYRFTEKKIAEHSDTIKLITLVGDNHYYLDFSKYEKEINNFLT